MTVKVEIKGVQSLYQKLKSLLSKFGLGRDNRPSVTVGFSQYYAIYVHEIPATHKVGQWKYLETAERQNRKRSAQVIKSAMAQGVDMGQALLMGGMLIQREAQLLTPVDTSALKASAFTCFTSEVEAVSQAAFQRSEAIRLSGQQNKKKT